MLQMGVNRQIARIRTGSTTMLVNWSFLPDPLTTWDRYVLSAFPKFWVSFSELWNQTRPCCTHPETKLSLTKTHKHICVCIHMLTWGPLHPHTHAHRHTYRHTHARIHALLSKCADANLLISFIHISLEKEAREETCDGSFWAEEEIQTIS